ncbi:hypothetical protein GBA52_028287 [Prunus armeniaca]|nr:hypothetical protein GBA52_028287 [Prunus armeniaca]
MWKVELCVNRERLTEFGPSIVDDEPMRNEREQTETRSDQKTTKHRQPTNFTTTQSSFHNVILQMQTNNQQSN